MSVVDTDGVLMPVLESFASPANHSASRFCYLIRHAASPPPTSLREKTVINVEVSTERQALNSGYRNISRCLKIKIILYENVYIIQRSEYKTSLPRQTQQRQKT